MIGMSPERLKEIEADRKVIREFGEAGDRQTESELAAADPAQVPREVQFAAQRDARYKWPNGLVGHTLILYPAITNYPSCFYTLSLTLLLYSQTFYLSLTATVKFHSMIFKF